MIDGTIPIPACTLAARIRDPDEGHEINELPNTSSLHEAVPAAAALDAGSLAATYSPLNVYAWILPVLGFIGTASGMASASTGSRTYCGVAKYKSTNLPRICRKT